MPKGGRGVDWVGGDKRREDHHEKKIFTNPIK